MAITSTGLNAAIASDYQAPEAYVDKSILGKDDFMKLLLVELQHQDPTEPMDSEKILSQTSQLATLEASDNTTKALEDLSKALGSAQQFSNVAAIGKTADVGSNSISFDKGDGMSTFELYFPSDVKSGTIEVTDLKDNVVGEIELKESQSGVYKFTWDGLNANGNMAETGIYRVNSNYKNAAGSDLQTRIGAYPIESVRFEGGKTLVKLGSNYVPLENIVEVY